MTSPYTIETNSTGFYLIRIRWYLADFDLAGNRRSPEPLDDTLVIFEIAFADNTQRVAIFGVRNRPRSAIKSTISLL
jgi:hypothetical protein